MILVRAAQDQRQRGGCAAREWPPCDGARQFNGRHDELAFVFPARRNIAAAQLEKDLIFGRFAHVVVHPSG